jgi:sn-glycerol 3-phosphate transport system permease protein
MVNFFKHKKTAWFFIFPQMLITLIFFLVPAIQALTQSFFYSDPFGVHYKWAFLENYKDLFLDSSYLQALWVTILTSSMITLITLGLGLFMANLIVQRQKSQSVYKSLLIWPYAVAPAVAAVLWRFLCHPGLGWLTVMFDKFGVDFNYLRYPYQALFVIILTASWQQFSYNFLFYFASLKAIPQSLIEAAILDGAPAWRRFWQIIFPLLSPTTFFLFIMNIIYSFFDTFGIIHVLTQGGPGNTTTNLIYKVYEDGYIGMDIGSSSAQSVLLMLLVTVLTLAQFKFLEKKVHYK